MDLSLPYILTDSGGDIEIVCGKCGEKTFIDLQGVVPILQSA
jgi:hypothetical protein